MEFSENEHLVEGTTHAVLKSAGWHEHRRYNPWLSVRRLRRIGYDVHEMAESVLCRFGGLTIQTRRIERSTPNQSVDICMFGNFRAFNGYSLKRAAMRKRLSPPDAEFLKRLYGWTVCYVGSCNDVYYSSQQQPSVILSVETGECILCPSDWLQIFVSESFEDMLEFLLSARRTAAREIVLDGDERACSQLLELGLWP